MKRVIVKKESLMSFLADRMLIPALDPRDFERASETVRPSYVIKQFSTCGVPLGVGDLVEVHTVDHLRTSGLRATSVYTYKVLPYDDISFLLELVAVNVTAFSMADDATLPYEIITDFSDMYDAKVTENHHRDPAPVRVRAATKPTYDPDEERF